MVHRRRLGLLGWGAAAVLFVGLLGQAPVAIGAVRVEWSNGLVSVAADAEPLGEVVLEVARRAGIDALGVDGLREAVTIGFAPRTLREALERLLSNVGYMLVEDSVPGAEPRVTGVFVYQRDRSGDLAAAAPPAHVGPEAAAEDGAVSIALDAGAPIDTGVHADIVAQWDAAPAAESEHPELRALRAAAERGDHRALRQALRSADEVVSGAAFELLARADARGAILALEDRVTSDRTSTRLEAVQLLHQTRWESEDTVLAALGRALEDRDVAVKTYAVEALTTRGGSLAWASLSSALRDPDPAVRLAVVDGAAQSEEGHGLLNQALADRDDSVHTRASYWLEQSSAATR